jgi:hypothetical protein
MQKFVQDVLILLALNHKVLTCSGLNLVLEAMAHFARIARVELLFLRAALESSD